MSHSPFVCNLQNRFWDSEPIVTCFLSNRGGNLDIRISSNSAELHPAPCMHVVCHVRGLGLNHTSKQNFFVSYSFDFISETHESKEGHL